MLYVMILAHLVGDYFLQFGCIARWKARSLWGVAAHGSLVTLAMLIGASLADSGWWPYAAWIGLIHTAIDVVRARLLRIATPTGELIWYLLDQLAHLAVIVLVVKWSGAPAPTRLSGVARWLADPRLLAYAIGYVLLANPSWVLLRFVVRGVWGAEAAPALDQGEKYGPMIERVLIATCVLTGQFHLAPLVMLPRRLVPIRVDGNAVGVLVRPTSHWAETLLSFALAVVVGWGLRLIGGIP